MFELDLGEEIEIRIKWKGQVYTMREPTVSEVNDLRAPVEETDGTQRVIEFLVTLGMPRDVVLNMGMSKARELIDGLMANLSKKN